MSDGGASKAAYTLGPNTSLNDVLRQEREIVDSVKNAMNPSGTTNSVVSNHMGYGSFSGADIKVVVHYPRNPYLEKIMNKEKVRLEYELYQYDSRIDSLQNTVSSFGSSITPKQVIDLIDERSSITKQLDDVDRYLEDIKNLPTSKVLAELQTISYSIFREKSPVRTLGSVYPRAYVRGPRTIGGSMIFTVFHKHVLHEVLSMNLGVYSTGTSDHDRYRYSTNLPDQIPPIDMSIIFANEYGAISHMGLWGVEFVQEGSTFSIEDIFTENTVQYVARDLDPMRVVNVREIDGKGVTEEWTKTASGLMYEKQQLNSHLTRRNPFL